MFEYKAYWLDRSDRVVGRIDLLCENEEDAMSQAVALVGIHSIELCKGDKLIARFEGFPGALS